eukprot:968036-Amphidinium_carterae.1
MRAIPSCKASPVGANEASAHVHNVDFFVSVSGINFKPKFSEGSELLDGNDHKPEKNYGQCLEVIAELNGAIGYEPNPSRLEARGSSIRPSDLGSVLCQ